MAVEIEVKVPEVGESITEVEIGNWLKAVGDSVQQDEDLVVIETDKATVEVFAPQTGTLSKILKKSGETAHVGEVIGHLEIGDAKTKNRQQDNSSAKPAAAKTPPRNRRDKDTKRPDSGDDGDAVGYTDDLPETEPTSTEAAQGPDVERPAQLIEEPQSGQTGEPAAVESEQRQPEAGPAVSPDRVEITESSKAPLAPGTDHLREAREEKVVPMTQLRRRVAERLVEAQQTAALLTTFNEIDMSAVDALRQRHQDDFKDKHNVKLGLMSFFVKAAIEALKGIPEVNAEIRDQSIVYRSYFDIGVAVGGGRGLVVPVLRNAERMSFAGIEKAVSDIARRARENKLRPDELQGGTFTITNGGVYGSLLSTPIINPPQSAILGMHAIQDRPVVRDGAMVIRPMMYVALTYDHRIIDGREAVTFLKQIKESIEEPVRMLLQL
ncbi:MAG: 2-oxoglutarate dehydrogenase complex dihydrolipoyllysine-residue succinyltransferase [Deltaproteobacteria bacterium]|nr:2-oxoglutarate dehydrogenase complex dihydrolipoyllysine-residue succinyltransferase [Deltaproteobacteria bacterium]